MICPFLLRGDHNPLVAAERKRIEAAGGTVEGGRVCGSLEVSRSFGDLRLKGKGVSRDIYMYIYLSLYIYIYKYMCIYIYVYIFICMNIFIYMYICTYSYVYIHTYKYVYICIYMHTYIYVYAYMYT